MIWSEPTFCELRMDAEIGSYQEDSGPGDGEAPVPPVVKEEPLDAAT